MAKLCGWQFVYFTLETDCCSHKFTTVILRILHPNMTVIHCTVEQSRPEAHHNSKGCFVCGSTEHSAAFTSRNTHDIHGRGDWTTRQSYVVCRGDARPLGSKTGRSKFIETCSFKQYWKMLPHLTKIVNSNILFEECEVLDLSVRFYKEYIEKYSRDPCRAPFQWNTDKNAGFSKSDKTWLPVHPDFTSLNVQVSVMLSKHIGKSICWSTKYFCTIFLAAVFFCNILVHTTNLWFRFRTTSTDQFWTYIEEMRRFGKKNRFKTVILHF